MLWPHGHFNDGRMEILATGTVGWTRFLNFIARITTDGA
jgi:hypothetical protein